MVPLWHRFPYHFKLSINSRIRVKERLRLSDVRAARSGLHPLLRIGYEFNEPLNISRTDFTPTTGSWHHIELNILTS